MKPLNILMVMPTLWSRNLGAPRVNMDLADEFKKLGHHVEKFTLEDAFPCPSRTRLGQMIQPSFFSSRAANFIRREGHRFDVIDANHGCLPYSKKELRFGGVLVARSHGLYAFYEQFNHLAQVKWPVKRNWKSWARVPVARIADILNPTDFVKSLQLADLITLLNQDEFDYVDRYFNLGQKARVIPNGLGEARFWQLSEARRLAKVASKRETVVFIGAWGPRKGSKDWGEIIRKVRDKVPTVQFLFLGTGVSADVVQRDIQVSVSDWVMVVPNYQNNDLPKLLAGAAVGAFPSYIEGHPLAVLEKLGAGLPVVAYDIPGTRCMLKDMQSYLSLTPVGDIQNFSEALIRILMLEPEALVSASTESIRVADKFKLSDIALATLKAYEEAACHVV